MLRPTVHRACAVATALVCAGTGVLATTTPASAAVTVHEGSLRMSWGDNCESVWGGYTYREVTAATVASVMYDDADRPTVGETFYVKVEASATGNPYPCLDQKMLPDLTLPAGVNLAVSADTPIRCTRLDYTVDPYTVTPETALCPSATGAPDSGGSVGLRTSDGEFWTIPTGTGYEIYVPLVASKAGYVDVTFPVRIIDGNDNPILTPSTPYMYVEPAPTTPTTPTATATPTAPATTTPPTVTPTTLPTTDPNVGGTASTPPSIIAKVARRVRLARTRGKVPVQVSVSPTGSRVRLVVQIKPGRRWTSIATSGYRADESGQRVKIRLASRVRSRLSSKPVKARLVATATSPAGVVVRTRTSFRIGG